MTDSAQPSPGPASTLTCGNCGVPVQPADVTCPACGVLLAAYQAPAGSTGDEAVPAAPVSFPADSPATHDRPSPAISSTPPPATVRPPRHQPRSQSPIGDALRRSRESGSTGPEDLASDDAGGELARMAADDSPLARAVEAELTGAKVVFDGNAAVIETDQAELTHTPDGTPVVAPHAPGTPGTAAVEPGQVDLPRPDPVESAGERHTPAGGAETQRPSTGGLDPATVARWAPFILIGCFVLGFGRSLPGFGVVIGFALVIGLVYVLIKVAAATGRKTTSMPRDDRWNAPRSRWRK